MVDLDLGRLVPAFLRALILAYKPFLPGIHPPNNIWHTLCNLPYRVQTVSLDPRN